MSYYLKVNGKEFDDINYPLPSKIIPGIEYIKKVERSLGGKLHVDISDNKQTLQIIFDSLEQNDSRNDFEKIMNIFEANAPSENGLLIQYSCDFDKLPDKNIRERHFFTDDVSFNPLIVEGGIKWRDVKIKLLEI